MPALYRGYEMRDHVHRRDTCRLCGSKDLELVIKLTPTPVGDAYVPADKLKIIQETYPLDLYLCKNCGHVQMLDIVDPEILFGEYTFVTSSSPGLVEHFRKAAEELTRRTAFPAGSLVVEIGSNDGVMLRFFKDKGMRVLGIDPARDIAKKATEAGLETLPTYFTYELAKKIKDKYGPASMIIANNVFAHVDDLVDIAKGIQHLLAPDGIFVFEVSSLIDVMQKMLFDTIYHEHLSFHSLKPLQTFFSKYGMELIDVSGIPTKGGSMRGIVQLAGGKRQMSRSVDEMIELEKSLGIDKAETFREFAARINKVKSELLALLKGIKAKGKTIAGYGASVTVTTLVYNFELGPFLSFIVDDNRSKQGLFSPGYHIPVLSPQELRDKRPDYVIILVWNYAPQIMKKNQAYLDRGGHFIVPLPGVKVL